MRKQKPVEMIATSDSRLSLNAVRLYGLIGKKVDTQTNHRSSPYGQQAMMMFKQIERTGQHQINGYKLNTYKRVWTSKSGTAEYTN